MPPEPEILPLKSLDYIPYLDSEGYLPKQFEGKVGAYAIFDRDQTLQFIGYSRDIYLSLKQHLVRQPQSCYWLKVKTIDRPSRTALEATQHAWINENGSTPPGNNVAEADPPGLPRWDQAIDVKAAMTAEEKSQYTNPESDEQAQRQALKNAARRIEAEILAELQSRHVQEVIRFNPKLKDNGLLDLK